MKKIALSIFLLFWIFLLSGCNQSEQNNNQQSELLEQENNTIEQNPWNENTISNEEKSDTNNNEESDVNNIQEFDIKWENYKFILNGKDNPEIKVNKWDTIKIEFSSNEGFHDFIIDEFEWSQTSRVRTWETTTIEFVANKTGSFNYYCSVWSHRQLWMEWTFIVE